MALSVDILQSSRYATTAGDRSKYCRSVAPCRNQSYDPEIVRSGVTVALATRVPVQDGPNENKELVQWKRQCEM